ncbi:cell division protein FtsQ/DivIB [Buchananella hordeovulneris]|uniref:cell division protein FtsQ/DivIB n=1 Tax=Buchananella hordeovulneris TaxID=52770 RepID=UPI000F5DD367|nr:cell division protein FtsQ/DivIB [Buchananella hordeovulneris]RRD44085.1 FtsQ-type POTRA domain-containing protein [Buchananella hordeovulneris]
MKRPNVPGRRPADRGPVPGEQESLPPPPVEVGLEHETEALFTPAYGHRLAPSGQWEDIMSSPEDLTARIAEREEARVRRRRSVVITCSLVAALAVAIPTLLLTLPLFKVQISSFEFAVEPAGEELPPLGPVLHQFVGRPLLTLDKEEVKGAIEQVTLVRQAEVSTSWPNSVQVQVVMRTPVAIAQTEQGPQLVDSEGVVLGPSQGEMTGLPLVEIPVSDVRTRPALQAALKSLASLDKSLREQVVRVQAQSADTVVFLLPEDRVVVWGDASELELKSKVLATLLTIPAKRYDVSSPHRPATSEK